MSKFKIGDRVKVVACKGSLTGKEKMAGREFVIVKDESLYDGEQSWSGGFEGGGYRYKESELERIPSRADIDREMMEKSEIYVHARFPVMLLQEPQSGERHFYDAAQMRASFRAGYDYAMRSEASARETLASIRYALDRDKK